MPSRKPTLFDLATGMGLASMHAGITLWHRLPLLMTPATTPRNLVELNRMVSEKITAAVTGAAAGQVEMLRIAAATLTGRLTEADVHTACSDVAHATLAPSFKTVKLNSRRLARKRRRR